MRSFRLLLLSDTMAKADSSLTFLAVIASTVFLRLANATSRDAESIRNGTRITFIPAAKTESTSSSSKSDTRLAEPHPVNVHPQRKLLATSFADLFTSSNLNSVFPCSICTVNVSSPSVNVIPPFRSLP